MPMAVVNLASLSITIFDILNATLVNFESHPTHVKTLAVATHYLDEESRMNLLDGRIVLCT